MPGRAYTQSGYEPEMHERWSAGMMIDEKISGKKKPAYATYKEIQEYRKRGESYILGHYSFEMMYDIYAGIEDPLVEGSIDSHLHIYPDYVPRDIDILDLAVEASKARMKAIVCKDHFFTNVQGAWAAQQKVEDLVRRGELEYSCQVLGTHVLAWTYHPDQINLIRKYPNLGYVMFPTMTGRVIPGAYAGPPTPVIDKKGNLKTEVKECIDACKEYKIPMMTGHTGLFDAKSRRALCQYAADVGCSFLITHAGAGVVMNMIKVDELKEWAKKGLYLDVQANSFLPNMMHPSVNPNTMMDVIKAVGPTNNLVATTDFGQPTVESPIPGWKHYIRCMIHFGFTNEEITAMVKTNPSKWLGI